MIQGLKEETPYTDIQYTYKTLVKSHTDTPLKFNMEPEKKSLEKEIPFGNHHFQVPC